MKRCVMFFGLLFCSILFAFGQTEYFFRDIAYGNGRFVVVASSSDWEPPSGRIAHSADGINWTAVTANTGFSDQRINSITYGGGRFVAVGGGGRIATSTDGISWLAVTNSPFGNDERISRVAYGNGRFVAVSGGWSWSIPLTGRIAHSADGINWTLATNSPLFDQGIGVLYLDGIRSFIAWGWTSAARGARTVWEHSSDGINWTPLPRPDGLLGANTSVTGITHGNGRFVAIVRDHVNEQSTTVVSTDGINWLPQTNVPSIVHPWEGLHGIVFGGGNFVAFGGAFEASTAWGIRLHSSDGINWTGISDGFGVGTDSLISSIVYGGGRFVAFGGGGRIAISTDGIDWTIVTTAPDVFR